MLCWVGNDQPMKMRVISRAWDKKPMVNNNQKTPQALGCVQYLADNHGARKILVLCRKSIRTQWRDDGFAKFTNMHAVVVEGDRKKRMKAYETFDNYFKQYNGQYPLALVSNYHTVMHDTDILKNMGFDVLVIDEAHRVKARTGKMNKAIQKVVKNTPFKMFLTGTPVMTDPEDVYGIVQIADKDYFGPWQPFERRYLKKIRIGRFMKTVGYMHLDELRAKVQNIIIRRTEHEVDIELPSMIPIQQDVPMDAVQYSMLQRHESLKVDLYAEANELKDDQMNNGLPPHLQDRLNELNQILGALNSAPQAIANDPRLFFMSKSKALKDMFMDLVPVTYKYSPKTQQILETVKEIIDSGHKVILFSKYERQARLTAYDIEKELGINVLMLTGQMSDNSRNDSERLFKNDPAFRVLVGTDAMSEGLNLQMSRYVIHIDQADTPAIKTQRNGRVRRAGSAFSRTYYYDMITTGSYDENRLEALKKHALVSDSTVELDEAQRSAIKMAMADEKAVN